MLKNLFFTCPYEWGEANGLTSAGISDCLHLVVLPRDSVLPDNRSLTRAALIGAATVRERLPQDRKEPDGRGARRGRTSGRLSLANRLPGV